MKRIMLLTVVALAVGVLAPTVHAGLFTLTLDDGIPADKLTITDGGAGDANANVGAITFIGSIGNWSLNVTTGQSKPFIGGPSVPQMDLNSVNTTSSGPGGTLTIMLTDSGFSLSSAAGAGAILKSEIGGTAAGTVTLTQILDRDNNDFGTGSDIVSLALGPFGPGAFSATVTGAAPVSSNPFSLTEVLLITHPVSTVGITTSLDASSTVVPVPAAVLLGLLGLGAAGVKLRRFA